ncbi:MAG TPA: NAD(P)H-dependent oxidoreductase [Acidimicrobiales bacterium]|jgi:putative NADPH-quinone reductase|nr:NAD(P)H-dependent oxidoreductase [Acidimicrobiales bacterium]
MRVLAIHAHPSPESFNRLLFDTACTALRGSGHEVTELDLYGEDFRAVMSADERAAYDTDEPVCSPDVARHAGLVGTADVLLFVYPTWWMGVPAILKGWLDRVLVPGVAFHLDERTNRVRPGLGHVRRIIGITTYGSSRSYVRVMTDGGRRTLLRALRMLVPWGRRTTWLALYGVDTSTEAQRARFVRRVEERVARL